jgi:drug/metabolite transporter (DMT)-like permease
MNGIWTRMDGEAKGILLIVAAILMFSFVDATAKALTPRFDTVQVVWARYAGQTLWTVLIFFPRLPALLATDRLGLHLLRSALIFGSTVFFFAAIARLQLAEATAIFEVAPVIITLLGVLILKERVGIRRWLGVAAGLVGALVIIRPGTEVFAPAALLPLAAATCFAGYSIATRFLGPEENPYRSLLYTALVGTVAATVALPFFWTAPAPAEAALMLGLGGVGMLGQLFLILALRHAPASLIAPFAYCSLVFNTAWGFLFFAEVPDRWTVAGGIVIVGAGLYIWHREMRLRGLASAGPLPHRQAPRA